MGKGTKDKSETHKNDITNESESQKTANTTERKFHENSNKTSTNKEINICVNIPYKIIQSNETKQYTLFYIITEK